MTWNSSLAAIFMTMLSVWSSTQTGNKPEPLTQWCFKLFTLCSQYNTTEMFMVLKVSQCRTTAAKLCRRRRPHGQGDQLNRKPLRQSREKMTSSQALGQDKKTVLSADSSSYGLGATLMQWDGDRLVPIDLCGKRYSQIEMECLTSTWACGKFAKYLILLDSFQLLLTSLKNKDIDKAPVRC